MLRNILIVARRDFVESIKTKAFLIGLIVAPILFGSGFIGIVVMQKKPDVGDRRIAVVDRTGKAAATVIQTIREKNERELYDPETHAQTEPRYLLEAVAPDDAHSNEQRLALSHRVHPGDLYAFIEIGRKALHPDSEGEKNPDNGVQWYSNESQVGGARVWMAGPIGDGIRRVRLSEAGVDTTRFPDLLGNVRMQEMNLVSRDKETGAIKPAEKRNQSATVVPLVLVMMIFMIVMITSAPMLNAIAEDKMQRVFEMLLASATPFDLIAGKVLGALGRSLLSSAVYIGAALFLLNAMALIGIAPFELIPWFLFYLVAEMTMLCAMAAALGAACGSPQDAQSLGTLLFAPILVPLMMIGPVMQNPNGGLALGLSLFPPFTPLIMMLRQGMPGGVPAWQPWVGLAGTILGAIVISWMAARIFRIAILLQGKPPNVAELVRWAVNG
jgi:ABC-2 type transport system permease protein